ncbi:MAG: SDR family NAD(P)-dependent oxidoreductase [Candidatus Cloacimonetes bacterium]|nr:SDR family NAD(P)-dependent oxidoreductase [Candidatus Cloacimonadota bacterium]
MTSMRGRRILITGASSGIGEACARRFAAEGCELVLWARRVERLARLADELEAAYGRHVHIAGVDVRDRPAVLEAVDALVEAGDVPDVLVNNAGLASGLSPVQDGSFDDWDRMIDTNVKGLLNVTRAVLPHMIRLGRGHVVNIGSTAGRWVYPNGNVYNATKFAVRALTEAINIDVVGTPIRVSSIDPGMVETEFSIVRFAGDEDRARKVYEGFQPLRAEDIADAVHYVTSAPPHVNVLEMLVLPTAQRNVYVLHRDRQ